MIGGGGIGEGIVIKLLGAIGGSVISLAYLLPKSKMDAAQRFCVGLTSGFLFGPLVSAKLKTWGFSANDTELLVAGCAGVSFISWAAAGFIYRWIAASNSVNDLKGKK